MLIPIQLQAAARFMHRTMRNSSMMISHVIGPEEKVALDNHPIKSLYFLGGGLPQVKLKFLYQLVYLFKKKIKSLL